MLFLQDITDEVKLVSFLQQREGAKLVLLDVLLNICQSENFKLSVIGDIFNLLNSMFKNHVDNQLQQQMGQPASGFPSPNVSFAFKAPMTPVLKPVSKVLIDQADLYTHLFSILATIEPHGNNKNPFFILMEYYTSLSEYKIKPQHFLDELVINLLVRNKSWFQLHQLLQYHVISDSKSVACLLLSLGSVYQPAEQLALDVLYRLKNSNDEILEILLSKKHVISALKFAQSENLNHVPAKKFLETAIESGDNMLFYNVYTYFKTNNYSLGRDYDKYHKYFKDNYPDE